MCACGLNFVSQALASNYAHQIPAKELAAGTSSVKFKTAFCRNPEKFNAVFKGMKDSAGNDIKADTIERAGKIGDFHDGGNDVKYYGKDFSALLDSIVYDEDELNKKECQIAFVLPY